MRNILRFCGEVEKNIYIANHWAKLWKIAFNYSTFPQMFSLGEGSSPAQLLVFSLPSLRSFLPQPLAQSLFLC